MSISSLSLWQQDQNFWYQGRQRDRVLAAQSTLISDMAALMTNQAIGLSSIANQKALARVNSQIAAEQKKLQAASGSTSASPPALKPATAIGTIPLTTSTPLSTLRIPPNGAIAVSDGTNTTTYSSTGTDTVADLIGAINANVAGNAYVSATLNGQGKLVITAKNTKESITVSGTFAPAIGFGPGHQTFHPTTATTAASTSNSAATSSSAASKNSATNNANKAAAALQSVNAAEAVTTAASLLSSSGAGGNIVNLLA